MGLVGWRLFATAQMPEVVGMFQGTGGKVVEKVEERGIEGVEAATCRPKRNRAACLTTPLADAKRPCVGTPMRPGCAAERLCCSGEKSWHRPSGR